jgi:hypothetical protein
MTRGTTAALWLAILCMVQLLVPASLQAASVGAVSIVSGCSAPLKLTLRPGLTEPNNRVSMPAAPNIPPGPVVIQVPLYPGATPSSLPMPHAAYSYPASQYLKAATAEYEVSTDWTTASNWYRQAFVACGYTLVGSGSSGQHGVTVSIGLALRDPMHAPLEVALAFTHGPAGKTLVLYVAYTIALPPQPAMVARTPRTVDILSYRPLVPGQLAASRPNKYVIVRDSPSINNLIRHLNALPPPGGVMSCPSDNGSRDELIFGYPKRPHVTVDVGVRGCQIVRSGNTVGTGLADPGLFRLLASLLARKTAVHLGAPFDARTLRLVARRVHTSDGRATFLTWNPGGTEYTYLDRGGLWVADRDNRWRREIAAGPVAQGTFDASGDFLYRPVTHGGLGLLTVVAQASRLDHYRYAVPWAPRTPIVGTQAGMGMPWSNGTVGCVHVWFTTGGGLIGIDPHYRMDTAHSRVRLPLLTAADRIAVSCDGSLVAIAAPAGGLQIRDVQSGRLLRRLSPPSPVTGLSWGTDNHTLAYVTGGIGGTLSDIDAVTGRQHLLVRLGGDSVRGMTWDPYARTIAFSQLARTGIAGELDVVNADGSGLRVLDLQGGSRAIGPQWSNLGGVMGFTRETLGVGVPQRANVEVDYFSVPHPYPLPQFARHTVLRRS